MADNADDIEVKQEETGSEAQAPTVIVTWSKGCPNWQQDALRRLCTKVALDDTDLEMWRSGGSHLALRGGLLNPLARPEVVRAQGLGHGNPVPIWLAPGDRCDGSNARGDPPPGVDRWHEFPVFAAQKVRRHKHESVLETEENGAN